MYEDNLRGVSKQRAVCGVVGGGEAVEGRTRGGITDAVGEVCNEVADLDLAGFELAVEPAYNLSYGGAQGSGGGSAPFCECFLLDLDPLLLKGRHGGQCTLGLWGRCARAVGIRARVLGVAAAAVSARGCVWLSAAKIMGLGLAAIPLAGWRGSATAVLSTCRWLPARCKVNPARQ